MTTNDRAFDLNALLDETVRVSRVLGQDPFMVLHGGGNTSAKDEHFLWAKASGFDLGALTRDGLVKLRRQDLSAMLAQPAFSDVGLMEGYASATVRQGQPAPTIEALLHHALPFASVLHTHADAVVALTDTVHGIDLAVDVLGDDVLPIPYVMPGFELAQLAAHRWAASGGGARALVLQHHGLFTMAETPEEALELHVRLVGRAENHVRAAGVNLREAFDSQPHVLSAADGPIAAHLLETLSPYFAASSVALQVDDAETRAFLGRSDLTDISQRGPTTLEHVIRTKRVPMLGGDVDAYVRDYQAYFERNGRAGDGLRMLSPAPRVILHPDLGLVTVGDTLAAASAVMDIYRHTIRIIEAAERMGGYHTIAEEQAFRIEYWELEQRRLA